MPASETAVGTEKAANASSGPGGRLRQAREAQGLQLEEVANELRMGVAALAALEDNRFEALGAAVFARGYLKQYGARLGLDPQELLALYERAADQPEVVLVPTKRRRLRDERRISRRVVVAFVLVLVAGGLGYWWWRQSPSDSTPPVAGVDRDAETTSPAMVGADATEAGPAAAAGESAPELAAEPESESERTTALDAESPPAADNPSPEAAPPLDIAAAPPVVANGPVLEVIFNQESWAEIIDEDGNRLYRDLGAAGTRTRLPASRNLNIYFGNAAGVEIRVDGEVVPLPRAAPSGIVRFDLDDVID